MDHLFKQLELERPPGPSRALHVGVIAATALAILLLAIGLFVYGRMREWYQVGPWYEWMVTIPGLAMSYGTLLLLSIAIVDARIRQNNSAAWARRARELDDLVAELTERQEQGLEDLSARLHDDIGAKLVAIKLEAESGLEKLGLDEDARRLSLESLDAVLNDVRGLSATLYPRMATRLGLHAGLSEIADRIRVGGLEVSLEVSDELTDVTGATAMILVRFVQEALINAHRHGAATKIDVSLTCSDATIQGYVLDNGVGWPAEISYGIGLSLLRERFRRMGGSITASSPVGMKGAKLEMELPRLGGNVELGMLN